MLKQFITAAAITISAGISSKAQTADTLWRIETGSAVRSINLSPDGSVIVQSGSKSTFVDGVSGKVKFTVPATGNNISTYPGTTFLMLDDRLFSMETGTEVFLGKGSKVNNNPMTVVQEFRLPQEGIILNYGYTDKPENEFVYAVDMLSGSLLWSSNSFFPNALREGAKQSSMGGMMGAAFKNQMQGNMRDKIAGPEITTAPLAGGNGIIVIPTKLKIFGVEAKTGKEVWSRDYLMGKGMIKTSGGIPNALIPRPDGNSFVLANDKFLLALDYASGKDIWPDFVKNNITAGYVYKDATGFILFPKTEGTVLQKSKAQFFTFEGEKKWETATRGAVLITAENDTKIAFAAENQNGSQTYNVIDKATGNLLFESKTKVLGQAKSLQFVQAGLLVITDRTVDVLNLTDGTSYNPDPFMVSSGKEFVFKRNQTFACMHAEKSDDVYGLDLTTGKLKVFVEKVQFKNNEQPNNIDITSDGSILLSSAQNMLRLSKEGTAIFRVYYPAPSLSTVWKVLNAAAFVASGGGGWSGSDPSFDSNADIRAKGNVNGGFNKAMANNVFLNNIMSRFNKTTSTDGFMYCLTTTAGTNDLKVAKVSKTDGQIKGTIDLVKKDRNPHYVPDDLSNSIFYAPDYSGNTLDINASDKNAKGLVLGIKFK